MKKRETKRNVSNVQPAKEFYFYEQCWKDLSKFIHKYREKMLDEVRKREIKMESGKGILSISGAVRFLACVCISLFGMLFSIILSVLVVLVFGLFCGIVFVFVKLLWCIDRLFLKLRGISSVCPECHQKYVLPTYVCPNCGTLHTDLTPGKYGVFYRKCNCGSKIPCHYLTNRSKLDAICPNPSCGVSLSNSGTKPIVIQVVGGRSSGKTAYINAFVHEFIEKAAPRNKIQISYPNKEAEDFYRNEILNDFEHGTTRMTMTEADRSKTSSKSVGFIATAPKMKTGRYIQICDVDGESFVKNEENEYQFQYMHCQGIVFVLDPLSIPNVRNSLKGVDPIDVGSLGTADLDLVLDSLQQKMRDVNGARDADVFTVPVAIVISKSDIRQIKEKIGEDAVTEYMTANNLSSENYMAAVDRLCRQFLIENDMESFVKSMDMTFKNTWYFSCSSIGHTREKGKYSPKDVLCPIEWIVRNTDTGMKNAWHENDFARIQKGADN